MLRYISGDTYGDTDIPFALTMGFLAAIRFLFGGRSRLTDGKSNHGPELMKSGPVVMFGCGMLWARCMKIEGFKLEGTSQMHPSQPPHFLV